MLTVKNVGWFQSKFLFIFVGIFLLTINVFSASYTTYQAKIVKPDGYPLEASSVNFRFTILDQAGSCILYSENYSAVNMNSTGGMISFSLGSGVKSYPVSSPTFYDVFNNGVSSHSCDAGGPPSYSPGANDTRKIVMQFHDGGGWQTLPAMTINAVPYAMYANDSQRLGGVSAASFVRYSTIPTCAASEALRYNGTGFNCVALPSSGNFTAGDVATALSYTPANAASFAGISSDVSTVSSTVYAVSSTLNNLSSNFSSLQNSVAVSLAAITSSQWVSSGSTIVYPSGNVEVGGGLRISMDPSACAANLAGTLRYNAGAVEFCNGVTWSAFGVSGAGLQGLNGSVSGTQSFAYGTAGTAPTFVTNNGVHTLNIPLASAGSVTGGLLSNADYSTFMNKITSSAASIAQVLGFTPANNASLANYAVRSSNLSDLASSATARTNLGVGYIGTLSSVDLGSADVSGTLATARLADTGVTAGTYSKVTVDAKGRVTSSSVLNSSDVTTALGFTPASNTALGNYLAKASNLSDLASSASARTNLGVGYIGTLSSVDLGSADVSGTLATARLANTGVTAGTYSKVTVDVKGRVTSSSSLTQSDITTALGFTPASNTALGNYLERADNLSDLASSATARTNLGVGYIGTLTSVNLGAADVSGTLAIARTPAYTGDVTKAAASASLILSNTGVTAGTYSKVTVDAKGRVTSSTSLTQTDITTALGFTPASNTALGNYLERADNLSDLVSSATARTNLGVGYIGTLTSVDLSSADVSGILAIARTPAYTGDVTKAAASNTLILSNTGVTAGTYAKVTVDAKGRVTSSSAMNAGDINTALGYTAANSATVSSLNSSVITSFTTVTNSINAVSNAVSAINESQWTTSSANIYFNTGNVGIGTSTPTMALDVSGTQQIVHHFNDSGFVSASAFSMGLRMKDRDSDYGGMGMVYVGANRSDTAVYYGDDVADNLRFVSIRSAAPNISLVESMRITGTGYVGIGVVSPTAKLELAAGTTSIAPFKIVSGSLLTTPQAGAVEYNGFDFLITDGAGIRRTIATATSTGALDNISVVSSPSGIALWPAAGNSVTVSATTASTNSQTGALIVKGGLGVAGNIYSSGTIMTSSNIQGSSITATSGMIAPYIAGSISSSGNLTLDSTTHATKGNILLAPAGGDVGIGLTNPAQKLDVNGGIKSIYGEPTASNTNAAGFSFDGDTGLFAAADGRLNLWSNNTRAMSLYNGNVGIGTSAPTQRLDVSGTVKATNFIGNGSQLTNISAANITFYDWTGVVSHVAFSSYEAGVTGFQDYTGTAVSAGSSYWSGITSRDDDNTGSQFALNWNNDGGVPAGFKVRAKDDNFGNWGQWRDVAFIDATVRKAGDTMTGPLILPSNGLRVGSDELVVSGTYVGIGTTTPGVALNIVGTGGGNDDVHIDSYSGAEAAIMLRRARGSPTSATALLSGDRLGFLSFRGYDGAAFDDLARIQSLTESDLATSGSANLGFYTTYNGVYNEKLRISASGAVGVGTTTPTAGYRMDVFGDMQVGNGSASQTIRFRTTNTDGAFIRFNSTADSAGNSSLEIGTTDNSDEPITFTQSGNERMRIHTNGGVGIGTNSPAAKLEVRSPTTGALTSFTQTTANAGILIDTDIVNATHGPGVFWRASNSSPTKPKAGMWMYQEDGPGSWLLFGTSNSYATGITNTAMAINPTGYVGIGTTTPQRQLHVNGDAYVNAIMGGQNNGSGNFHLDAWTSGVDRSVYLNWAGGTGGAKVGNGSSTWGPIGASAFNTNSDGRMKENIKSLENPLEKILKFNPVSYTWKDSRRFTEGQRIGLIAQDVEKIYPQAVRTDKGLNSLPGGTKLVNYSDLVSPIIGAIKELYKLWFDDSKELHEKLEAQKRQMASVQSEVEMLKEKSQNLEQQNKMLKEYLCAKDPSAKICK